MRGRKRGEEGERGGGGSMKEMNPDSFLCLRKQLVLNLSERGLIKNFVSLSPKRIYLSAQVVVCETKLGIGSVFFPHLSPIAKTTSV